MPDSYGKMLEELAPKAVGETAHVALDIATHVAMHIGLNLLLPGVGSVIALAAAPIVGQFVGWMGGLLAEKITEEGIKAAKDATYSANVALQVYSAAGEAVVKNLQKAVSSMDLTQANKVHESVAKINHISQRPH